MGVIGVVAVCAVAGWNYQQSEQSKGLSELALANIEALARVEGDTGQSGRGTCYKTITTKKGSKILYCGTCTYIRDSTDSLISGTGVCD